MEVMLYAQLLVRRVFARMGEFVVMQQLNQIGNEYKTKKKSESQCNTYAAAEKKCPNMNWSAQQRQQKVDNYY